MCTWTLSFIIDWVRVGLIRSQLEIVVNDAWKRALHIWVHAWQLGLLQGTGRIKKIANVGYIVHTPIDIYI